MCRVHRKLRQIAGICIKKCAFEGQLKRKQQNFNCPEHSQGTALVRKPCGVIPAGKVDSSECLTIKICVQNRVEDNYQPAECLMVKLCKRAVSSSCQLSPPAVANDDEKASVGVNKSQ